MCKFQSINRAVFIKNKSRWSRHCSRSKLKNNDVSVENIWISIKYSDFRPTANTIIYIALQPSFPTTPLLMCAFRVKSECREGSHHVPNSKSKLATDGRKRYGLFEPALLHASTYTRSMYIMYIYLLASTVASYRQYLPQFLRQLADAFAFSLLDVSVPVVLRLYFFIRCQ